MAKRRRRRTRHIAIKALGSSTSGDYRRAVIAIGRGEDEEAAVAALADALDLLLPSDQLDELCRRIGRAVDAGETLDRVAVADAVLEVAPHGDGRWIVRVEIEVEGRHRVVAVIGPRSGREVARQLAQAALTAPVDAGALRAALATQACIQVGGFRFTVIQARVLELRCSTERPETE